MSLDLEQLLAVPVYRALDVDPDGRVLVGTDLRGSMQLVEITPSGLITELTALPGPCSGRYVPGRRAVIVAHDDGGNESTQLSLLRLDQPLEKPAGLADLTALVRDARYMHTMVFVDDRCLGYITNRRNGVDFDLVIHDLATGSETVGYDAGGRVVAAQLSPDGRWVVLAMAGIRANSGRLVLVDLGAPAGAGRVRELTAADEHAVFDYPMWLPGSDAFIVTTNRDRDLTGIARVEPASGTWRWLVTDDRYDLVGWVSPDGRSLLVEANDDGASRLALHDAGTGAHARDVALPAAGMINGNPLPPPRWSAGSASIVVSITSAGAPGDALRIDASTGLVTALTASAEALRGDAMSRPEAHRIPTPDLESIPCLVYRPVTVIPALAGAAVVFIHGGPEGQSKRGYNPYIQALAKAGFTVVVPNVRGSTGYGKRWYSLDDVRLRLDSVADLASVHAYLRTLGLDPRRAALFGGSYGGYMVLAGLAFQPELWMAGVDIVGISSLVTFLTNTSPYRRAAREREYGSLTDDREFLEMASPLNRVGDIRAPLFVIHGANDPRVPVSEAHQVRAALIANGVECELLVYPDEGHGLAKRVNRLDAYPKAFAFLARHLGRHP